MGSAGKITYKWKTKEGSISESTEIILCRYQIMSRLCIFID